MLGSVLRNFGAFGAAYLVDRVVTFLFLLYAARVLGPAVFGQFILIGTYILFFNVAFTSGVMPVALREIARQRDNPGPVLEEVMSLRLILGLMAYAMLLLMAVLVLDPSTYLLLAILAGTSLVLDAFKDGFAAYHGAFERMVIPSAFAAAISILTAASGIALLYLDFGIVALLAAGAAVNLLLTVVWHVLFTTRFRRYRIRFAFSAWKNFLGMAAPIAPMAFLIQFNRLATVMMLSWVGGPIPRDRAVGLIGPAQQIAGIPLGFLHGLRRAMLPPVADKIKRGQRIDEEFALSLKMAVVFLSFPMLVVTSAFAREIVLVIFGPDYLESVLPLKLLGGATALTIAASFPVTFVMSYPETRVMRFLPGAVVTLLTNIALCVVLIPVYSVVGVALAYLMARAVYLVFFLYYSRVVLPLDSLGLGGMVGMMAVLCAAYAGCLLAASNMDQGVWRGLVIVAVAGAGMVIAGRAELAKLWGLILRRRR